MIYQIVAQISQNDLNLPKGDLSSTSFANVLKLVFGIAGAIAVLIITLAGFKYVMSQGDPQETAKAKNTIIDAIIGLIICLLAFGIVSFVIGRTT